MPSLIFTSGERLKSSKVISHLFSGKCPTVKAYPLIAVYDKVTTSDPKFPVQVAISVPKRKFKSAIRRNLLKRRIREAYRRHKADLYQNLDLQENEQIAVMLIYISNEILEFNKIESSVKKAIRKLERDLH